MININIGDGRLAFVLKLFKCLRFTKVLPKGIKVFEKFKFVLFSSFTSR